MCYLKLLNLLKLQLKLFKLETLWQPKLFETFELSFKDKKVLINPEFISD